MIYLYDDAICKDLNQSLGSDSVRVIDPESAVNVIGQIQEDNIQFPVIVVTRDGNYSIDTDRINYTMLHKGIPVSIDLDTNKIYNEKVLPINLNYNITILATNTADMDELVKELMFKYFHQYFLTIDLPYESDRKLRFGVIIDSDGVEQASGSVEYLASGVLYQTIIPLKCEGCVLLSYTPHQLHRWEFPEIIALSHRQAKHLAEENIDSNTYGRRYQHDIQEYRHL